MQNLPVLISIVFMFITFVTVYLFYKAANCHKPTLWVLIGWLLLQTAIASSGFYTVTTTLPPRFLLLVLPPILFIALLLATVKGNKYLAGLNVHYLTLLHTVRIPVELVLFWLSIYKVVPQLMTFEGRNFDILSGITAPFIFYFGFVKTKLSIKLLLLWNIGCLFLLVNIVATAILSAPFPFQQFAFEQPNIAIIYFPFNWLPSVIVPLVLLSHLVSIKQLFTKIVASN
jgi:hypothetical protein